MGRLASIINGCLKNFVRSVGPAVAEYERQLISFFGSADAIAFWKGRVALYAMLKGLDIGTGDEVIQPGYTCVVVPNAILHAGARPVYVDVSPDTMNITVDAIEKAITARTKAIIVQHSYGVPADMDPILELAKSNNIPIIEDCCHAFGSRYRGRLTGSFGVGAFFSGQWSKPFSTGLGGIAIINDSALAARVRSLADNEAVNPRWIERMLMSAQLLVFHLLVFPRTVGVATNVFRFLGRHGLMVGSSSAQELLGEMPTGYFKRISEGQATVGQYELSRFAANAAHRRKLTAIYNEMFAAAGWPTPAVTANDDPVLVRYPVAVANKPTLLVLAQKHLVELGDWFNSPLHGAEAELQSFGFTPGICPVSQKASEAVVNLPLHLRVSESAARKTVQFVLTHGKPMSLLSEEV